MRTPPIHFHKMHGLGNDFVVIDLKSQELDWESLPIQSLANRHLGVGCDQVLLISASLNADFFCRILNSDGSEAEQCGNGLRCVARYVFENGLTESRDFTIETVAGIFPVNVIDYDHIQLFLPTPDLSVEPMAIKISEFPDGISGHALSLGNPHFIIPVTELDMSYITNVGYAVSTHPDFPQGTNVGFVATRNPNHIELRTFERGAGNTYACGSNACAAVVTGILTGKLHSEVTVQFELGQLHIAWEGRGKPIVMTGPAVLVFTGIWF